MASSYILTTAATYKFATIQDQQELGQAKDTVPCKQIIKGSLEEYRAVYGPSYAVSGQIGWRCQSQYMPYYLVTHMPM